MAFIAKGGRVWRGRVSRIEPVRVGALGGVWHSVYFYGWRGVEDRFHDVEHFRIRETIDSNCSKKRRVRYMVCNRCCDMVHVACVITCGVVSW